MLTLEGMKPKGEWYEVSVPGTLDLAERAKFGINALIANMDPTEFYAVKGFRFMTHPPHFDKFGTWNLTPKNARTLPMLRAMNGSDHGLDAEYGMMRALMKEIRPDGNMYYPFNGTGPPKGTSYPQTNALMIFTMLNRHAQDGNAAWLNWINLLAKGLRQDAIRVEDRAYYPMQSGIDAQGRWHFMLVEGRPHAPLDPKLEYNPPDEPLFDQQGSEGAAKADQNRPMSALVHHYKLTGNKNSLETAQKLGRFLLKPGMWEDTRAEGYPGNEHGIWAGHGYNGPQGLNGLLDLAMLENSQWLKQFIREGYDHGIRNGVVRMGWFPAWVQPEKFNRSASLHGVTEICAVASMALLGVKLSDAGLGDYWDDVDSIIRNQLATQQTCDLDLMRRVSGGGSKNDAILKRSLGGFGNATANAIPHGMCHQAGCCTPNGSQALYYAWHGITRFHAGVATVNLFLNRASAWMDVDSYLPYEGKVVLRNKQAHTVLVRVPGWVKASHIKSFVGGRLVEPSFAGRYLLFTGLKAQDEIRLQFPVQERIDRYTIDGKQYTLTFRGSTVVGISPRDRDPKNYSMYERDYMKADKAPMRKIKRFVADRLVPLGVY